MTTMPTLFISHGGPDIVINDTEAHSYLQHLAELLPQKPRAIIILSAHFETDGVAVVTDPQPGMIYDFGGFAPELYKMTYSAPGEPVLAARIVALLQKAGLEPHTFERRGYDHGTWTPLKLAFPAADIPVVQVSIDPHRDARWHYEIGKALAPLREEGVLLIGSGHITHNLRAYFCTVRKGMDPDPRLPGKVRDFTEWFEEKLGSNDTEALLDWKSRAPFAQDNHPTPEHLMPIFFAYGAAGSHPLAQRTHRSVEHGFFANDSYLFH